MRKSLLFLLMSLCSLGVNAFQLEVMKKESGFFFALNDIEYSEALFKSEMNSGLPNDIELVLILNDRLGTVGFQKVRYRVTYDLWDENYLCERLLAGVTTRSTISNYHDLLAELSNLQIPNAFSQDLFVGGESYFLMAQVTLNSISEKRIERIKNWVSSNRISHSREVSSSGASLSGGANIRGSGGPTFKKLFDRILEKYMSDDKTSAQWRSEFVRSEPFSLGVVNESE